MSNSTENTDGQNEVFATEAEVVSAIQNALKCSQQRIARAAKWILQRHPFLRNQLTAEELIQEAFTAILDQRNWCKDKVEFVTFVGGVMRSIASNETRKIKTTHPDVIYVDESKELEESEVVATAERTLTPEEKMLHDEDHAETAARIVILRAQLGHDTEALNILNILLDEGIPKREIKEKLGMTDKQFWAADRRFQRVVTKFGGKE